MFPNFLPYVVAMQTEAQVNELSLELLLLQVIFVETYFIQLITSQTFDQRIKFKKKKKLKWYFRFWNFYHTGKF